MIVLSGTIGAGKTSLTKMLADHLDSQAFYESVDDNEILPLFYKDPKKYGFLLQMYFLNKRLGEIKNASAHATDVLDRSIFEDPLLFRLNADLGRATTTEAEIHESLVQNMMEELPSVPQKKNPDLLICVQVSFDTMLERIKKRGRSYEQIDEDPSLYDYYKSLNERYVEWFEKYDKSPKLAIDGDKFNFVESHEAEIAVLAVIDEKLKELAIK